MSIPYARKLKSANIQLSPERLYYKPQWLVLGVNNLCNLHCKMCDVGTQTLQTNFATNLLGAEPLNMPLALFERICDQAAAWCPEVKIGYAFTEPLIYPYLIESLQYAQTRQLYTAITTNALNLERQAQAICTAGTRDLFVSLDGPPDIHNVIRGHNRSFQRAIDGINLVLAESTRPEVSVFCTITEWNVGRLAEFAEFFAAYPLRTLGFMHTNFTTTEMAARHNAEWGQLYPATASNIAATHPGQMDLAKLRQDIETIRQMRLPFRVVFSPEISTPEQLDQFYNQPGQLIGRRCNDAFDNIMIKSDGTVIPAHGRCYNLPVGNLYQASLAEIWNSPVLGRFRRNLVKAGGLLPACARCCSAF
ncbi:MAG: SPASM domain-containing protein [Thermoflexales bacterium]|nr:SPASM domain-containing protein [Thermoflexales bacterium]